MHVVCTHANGGREGGNQSVCRWPTSRTMNQSASCWGGEQQQDRRGFVAPRTARSSRGAEKLRAAHLEASAGGARLGGALLLVGGSTLASFTALAALASLIAAHTHTERGQTRGSSVPVPRSASSGVRGRGEESESTIQDPHEPGTPGHRARASTRVRVTARRGQRWLPGPRAGPAGQALPASTHPAIVDA